MCGIAGEISFESGGLTNTIPALTQLLARRGPDDEGFWSDAERCALGFRRLAILDLSLLGHQPMVTPDGRYVLIYNGELYNYQDLKRDLEARGLRFRSTGDTEVLLHALAEWGTAALERFNGMFALALYDMQEKRLLLARDHAGIKPLYYMLTPRGLVFASQYDVLLAHPWRYGLEPSREALALYLRLGYIPAPYALLNNTYMLEPGAWLEIAQDGAIRRGTHFSFAPYQTPDLRGQEALEAVDAAVGAAVRRQMISDVPLGTFLSGGIDSPLIAAKMRAINGQSGADSTVLAFTIGTEDDDLDESDDAVRYARELGVQHTLKRFTSEQALTMLDDVVAACGEPLADFSIFPTMLVSRLARQRVTVMLSGDGGDELFWGYSERFGSVLQHAAEYRYPFWMRQVRWGAKKYLDLGSGHRALCYPTLGDYALDKQSFIARGWYDWLFDGAVRLPAAFDLFRYSGWEADETAQWLRWNEFTGHLTRVLLKVDRASMHHSLEVRVPLLDREVISVAARIDWRSCLDLKTRIGKIPLRQSLRRHVQHQTAAKRGFNVPMHQWLRGPLRPVIEESLATRDEILGLPINRAELARLIAAHLAKVGNFTLPIWTLLSLALWEQRHYRQPQHLAAV